MAGWLQSCTPHCSNVCGAELLGAGSASGASAAETIASALVACWLAGPSAVGIAVACALPSGWCLLPSRWPGPGGCAGDWCMLAAHA